MGRRKGRRTAGNAARPPRLAPEAGVRRQRQTSAPQEPAPSAVRPAGYRAPLPPQTDWLPLQAVMGAVVVGIVGYLIGEVSLSTRPHPLHWAVALIGALLGYAGGLVLFRLRGF